MRDYQPFELLGPTQVYGAFYKQLANQQRSIGGLQGSTVKIAQLSEISDDLGEVRAGVFVSSAANDGSGFPGDASFSGVVIAGAGIPTTNGDTGYISSWATDVTQFYVGPNGKLYAGAGAVTLDADGITLVAVNTAVNRIKWYTVDAFNSGYVVAFSSGTTPNRTGTALIRGLPEAGGAGLGKAVLSAFDTSANEASITVSSAPAALMAYLDTFGQTGSLHYGDYAGFTAGPDDTNEDTILTRTIKANSIAAKGIIKRRFKIHTSNTTQATNYTATIRIKWGGSTVFTGTTLSLSANTQRHAIGIYEVTITNVGATNAQELTMEESVSLNATAAGAAAGVAATDLNFYTTASVDTTADAAFAITVQKSNNNAAFDVELLGDWEDGPYYSA